MIVVLKPDTSTEKRQALTLHLDGRADHIRGASVEGKPVLILDNPRTPRDLRAELLEREEVERVLILDEKVRDVDRREFLDFLIMGGVGVTALASLLATVAFVIPPHNTIDPGGEVAIRKSEVPSTGAKNFLFKDKPAVLMESAGRYFAVHSTCTHSDVCTVEWDHRRQQLVCPCHSALFDVYGNVLAGPPKRALTALKVETSGDKIFISEMD